VTPKTPQELREQIERQNKRPAAKGKGRTAEGFEVPTPTSEAFLSNLEKVSKPEK
jgi:hypothetical protein